MFNLRLITNICNRYKLAFLRAQAKNAANEATTAAEFFLFDSIWTASLSNLLFANEDTRAV